MLHPTLPLGQAGRPLRRREELEHRILAVLRTTPGDVPWRPEFGCDLRRFLGRPLSPEAEDEIRWTIQEAIARFIPELVVDSVDLGRKVLHRPTRVGAADPFPVGRALLFLGTQVSLTVRLRIRDAGGVSTLDLDPFS